MMYKKYTAIFSLLLLTSCMSSKYDIYQETDLTEKTISLPAGAGGALIEIKKELLNTGWKIKVLNKSIDSDIGKNKITSRNNYNTRYTLLIESNQFDVCVPDGDDALITNASLIDNKSSSEIFTYYSRRCANTLAKELSDLINNKKKPASN